MLSELRRCSAGTKARRQTKTVREPEMRLHTFFSKVPGQQGPCVRGWGVQSIPLTRTPVGSRKPLSQEQRDAETCSLQR